MSLLIATIPFFLAIFWTAPCILNMSVILLKFALEGCIFTFKNLKLKIVIVTSIIVNTIIMGVFMLSSETEYFLSGIALIEVLRSLILAAQAR